MDIYPAAPADDQRARLGDELVATATMRTRYGRNGIYDVTVQRGDEIIAEFRGRSRAVAAEAS